MNDVIEEGFDMNFGGSASQLALAAAAVLLALGGCKTIHHIAHGDSCNKPQPYQRAASLP